MATRIKPKTPLPRKWQSSEDYWRERETRQRAENLKNEAETGRKINAVFSRMQDEIQQEINSFYGRYASKEGITIADAKERVSKLDIEQYQRLAAQYVKAAHEGGAEAAFSDEANEQMRLYNATMRINRLEMLKARCGLRVADGYREAGMLINGKLDEMAYSEYYRLAGILGNSVQFNENMVRSIVDASYQSATWSQRLWTNQNLLSMQIGQQIAQGILTGKGSEELARRIQKLTGQGTYNCQRLMRTELRRVQTAAAEQSMRDNGVTQFKFMVANGISPCDQCISMDGKVFDMDKMQIAVNAPPMHPNCVLPDTKIIAPGMEAIMQSEYSGNVVEFRTAKGARLTVTPNHIVLTARGWVSAKNLVKGDKVINYVGGGESNIESNPTDYNSVPSIEEIFTAFVKASGMSPVSVPAAAEDLKGDVIPNSKVNIVFIDCKLRDKINSPIPQFDRDVLLVRAIVSGEFVLSCEGNLNTALVWYGLAADGIMRRLSERGIFLGSSVTCANLVCFRTTADYNARLLQVSANDRAIDAVPVGKGVFTDTGLIIGNDDVKDVSGQFDGCIRRGSEFDPVLNQNALNGFSSLADDVRNVTETFSGIVQFDDVISVTSRFYSGHVYDTSSMSTLYTANGIITSNCHCCTAPYVDEAKWQRWLDSGMKEPWEEFESGDAEESAAPSFTPAKTKAEAEEFAKRFAGSVNFNGLSLENANKINQTLLELTSKYPINKLEEITNKPSSGAAMSANFRTLDIAGKRLGKVLENAKTAYAAQRADAEQSIADQKARWEGKKMPSAIKSMVDKLESKLRFSRFGVETSYDDPVKVTVTHEYGHILSDQYFGMLNSERANPHYQTDYRLRAVDDKWALAFQKAKKTGDIYTLSEYGSRNVREFFAESFAAREMGEKLPDYVEELMAEVLKNGIM